MCLRFSFSYEIHFCTTTANTIDSGKRRYEEVVAPKMVINNYLLIRLMFCVIAERMQKCLTAKYSWKYSCDCCNSRISKHDETRYPDCLDRNNRCGSDKPGPAPLGPSRACCSDNP